MKALALLGVLITSLGYLVGCSTPSQPTSTENEGGQEISNQEAGSGEKAVEKPDKIKLMYAMGFMPEDGTKEWQEAYKKNTGIDIELQYISVNEYSQKIDLAFASGDAPDVFAGGIPNYVAQNALTDLTDWVNASENLKVVNQSVWDSIEVKDKIYGVPLERGNGTVTYMRKDWLDKLGKEVPTTYEEYIDVLRAFKTLGDDIIPFTAAGLVDELYLRDFLQDASPMFIKVNDQWVDGMMQPEMEEALVRMRDAYAEGLIDMEIVTNKTSTCRDKWYAGKIGTFSYWAGNWNVSLEDRLKEINPEAEVVALPAIENVEYFERVPNTFVIPSTTKNAEGVFKYFLDYMYDGGEGSTLFQHGVEGVHWAKENNELVHLPKKSKPEELLEKALVTPALSYVDITLPEHAYSLDSRIKNSLNILEEDGINLPSMPVSKTLSKVTSDLTALREKALANIVLGKVDVKEGLSSYKQEVTNLGMEQILEEMNTN